MVVSGVGRCLLVFMRAASGEDVTLLFALCSHFIQLFSTLLPAPSWRASFGASRFTRSRDERRHEWLRTQVAHFSKTTLGLISSIGDDCEPSLSFAIVPLLLFCQRWLRWFVLDTCVLRSTGRSSLPLLRVQYFVSVVILAGGKKELQNTKYERENVPIAPFVLGLFAGSYPHLVPCPLPAVCSRKGPDN